MKKQKKIIKEKKQFNDELRKKINEEKALEYKREIMVLLLKRMKIKNISRYELSRLTSISQSTLSRYFNQESDFTLINYFKIVFALDFNSYLIPEENDSEEINEINGLYNEYIRKTYFNED